jgi:hypothetical protein
LHHAIKYWQHRNSHFRDLQFTFAKSPFYFTINYLNSCDISYCATFNNSCFSTNSSLFIPAFKSPQKLASSNNEATSHGFGSEGPDEQEAHKKLRVRKEELRKLTDDDDIIKHNKHHTANLLSR